MTNIQDALRNLAGLVSVEIGGNEAHLLMVAADVLEAMAAELSVCRAEVGHYQAERDAAEFRLAAMAPVVEAARAWAAARNGSGPYHLDCDRLEKALAKLEAANV